MGKSIAQDLMTMKLVARLKVGAKIMNPLLFVNITVQCIVLQVNGHATWAMMRWVVLCQKHAPMEAYALNQPCKHEEGFPHHNNDPKIDKICSFSNELIANGFI